MKTRSLCFAALTLLACNNAAAQFISYPVAAQSVTRGLDSSLLTVQISFPVCTNVNVTINLGATNNPGVIEYIPGSLTMISGTGTITESDISNLRSPVFNVGTTTFGQTLRFSIRRRASCGSVTSTKDNIVVTGTGTNCSFSETNANVNTYTLLTPAFTITPPASIMNAEVGNTYDRIIRVINGGNGCADTIGFWIKYPSPTVMQLNSLSFAGNPLTPKFTSPDSTYYELTGAILGTDNKLCNGGTIVLTENVTILSCNVISGYGVAGFDFSGNRCRVTKTSTGMSMSTALPSLAVMLAPAPVTSCFVAVPRVMNYKVKNNGAGPATNLVINTGNQINNNPVGNVYGYIDTASLTISVNGGTAFHPDASYYTGTTLTYSTPLENNLVCNQGKIAHLQLTLPPNIILGGGDSLVLSYNYVYCPSTNSCGDVYFGNRQGSQVLYKNACANISYSTGAYVGTTSFPYNNPSITSFEFPAQVRGGDCYEVTLSTNPLPTNTIGVRGYVQYELTIPAGVTFSAVNLIGSVASPHAGYPRVVGNTVITRYSINTTGNPVKFVFCTPSSLCTTSAIDATVTVSPDSSCVLSNSANINSVKRCSSKPINFICTTPCALGGVVPVYWKYGRKNYGLPDNNFNKMPDASGSVDPNIVFSDRYRPGDTLHSEYRSYVVEQTAPSSITSWNFINSGWSFSKHIWSPAGSATVTIVRGGTATVVPDVAITTVNYGKNFNVDFSQGPAALTALAPFLPNDSVIIEADFVLKDSLLSANVAPSPNVTVVDDGTRGKTFPDAPDVVLMTNNVYASSMANPLPSDQATCFVPQYYANTLHLYNFSLLYGNILTGCTPARHEIRSYTRKLGAYTSNYFPGEYRQEFVPDSLVLNFPAGMTVIPGSQISTGIYINNPPTFTAVPNAAIEPYVSITGSSVTGTTVVFDVKAALAANPSWKIQSEGTTYTFGIDARGSCVTPSTFSIAGSQTAHVFQWPSPSNEATFTDPARTQSNSTFSIANKPNVNISSPDVTSTPGSDTACWAVFLQNSSSQTAPFNFIRITGNASFQDITLKVGALTILPNADGLYELSGISAGATNTINICANTNSCALDSILVESGWDCEGYPTGAELQSYSCWKPLWLKADPLPTQIQLSVDKQPLSPDIALCTGDNIIFRMNSALANYADDPEFRVTVPVGMVIDSAEIEYPDGSGNWQTIVPDTSEGVLVYRVEAHSGVTTAGLPGTASNPGTANRAARLRLNYNTTCDFTSSSKVTVQQRAMRPCGSAVSTDLGFNDIIRSNPINITGANGPGIVGFDLGVSPSTVICGTSTISGTVTPAGASTSPSDTIVVTLPSGIVYNGNLTSADGVTLATGFPFEGPGGTQIVKLKVPPGVTSGNPINYSFGISTAAVNYGCGKLNILSEMERTSGPFTCGAIICPNLSTSIIGSTENIITVNKPDLSIVDLDYVSGDFSAGGAADVTITIANGGTEPAPAATYKVEFFCGTNTTPFASAVFPPEIPVLEDATAVLNITIPAAPACENGQPVTAMIRPLTAANEEQCLCQQTTRPIIKTLPVILSGFTARQHDCTILLNWGSLTEINLKRYELQYSKDGRSFVTIGTVMGRGDNNLYSFSHQPAAGRAYYRLKMVDNNGAGKFSSIIAMNITCSGRNVLIYPNPTNSILNVNLSGYPAIIKAGLYSGAGQLLMSRQLVNGSNTINVNQLPAGLYLLVIAEENNSRQVYKVQVTH